MRQERLLVNFQKQLLTKMMKLINSLNIRHNHYIHYLMGEVIAKTIDFIVVILMARLLSPSDYGFISVAYSMVPVFIVFFSLNLHSAIIRRFYESIDDYPQYLITNFLFVIFNSLLVIIVLFTISDYTARLINIPENLFKFTILIAMFQSYFEFYRSVLQARQNSKLYSTITILYSISLNLFLIIMLFYMEQNRYLSKPYANLIALIIFFIYSVYKLKPDVKWQPKFEYIRYSLVFGIPLIFQSISNVILGQIDRIMINSIVGSAETGIYSLAYNLGMIVNLIVLAINKAWLPNFYNNFNNISSLEKKLKQIISFVFIVTAFLVTYGGVLMHFLFVGEYFEAISIFPVVVSSYIFVFAYIIYSNYSFYYKKTFLVSFNTLLAGIINIALNYFLLPKMHYIVAAYITLFSYFILFIFHWLTAKYITKNKLININIFLKAILIFIIFVFFITLSNILLEKLAIILNTLFLLCYFISFKKINYI